MPDGPQVVEGRVLVVDDSAANRLLLRSMLTAAGYQVDEAESGSACLAYCAERLPSMILLDLTMPELGGLDACRRLRERHGRHEPPIIMVTARSESAGLVEGLSAGANDYLTTPVDRSVLMARLQQQLALARSQRLIEAQRRSLEQALRIQQAMGDALPEAVAVHDAHGALVYCNEVLAGACGGVPPSSITAAMAAIFDGVLQRTGSAWVDIAASAAGEFHRVWTEGERHIEVRSRSIPLAGGQAPLRLWVWRDVTAERLLARTEQQQVRLETVRLFSVGVAHNFNNIVGGLSGAAALLERATQDNPRARQCLEVIRRCAERAVALTRKMSTLERRGRENAVSPLAEVIENVVEIQRLLIDERIRWVVEVPGTVPPVQISHENLADVLVNLIMNSVEAIPGEGTITIRAVPQSGEAEVELTVTDTGRGMPPEVLARAFEPFFSTRNLDTVNQVSTEGNGLGLWNVYHLLRMVGGDISLESAPGRGTTARIRLPVAPGA